MSEPQFRCWMHNNRVEMVELVCSVSTTAAKGTCGTLELTGHFQSMKLIIPSWQQQ